MSTSATVERTQRPSADGTRERILVAAIELFANRSFEGASTRQIALAAGVPQPLLTYHFGSKEELWQSAVSQLFGQLTSTLDTRLAELRGVDQVTVAKLVVAEFVRFSASHPQLHRVIMQECKSEGERLTWLVEHHVRPLYEGAFSLMMPLVESGHVRNLPPANLYYLLTGAVATFFVLAPECRLLTGVDPTDHFEIERHVEAVQAMIFLT